jgi:23S rRNA (pseudouridine1915-N3)-methyltransferase
MKIALLDIGKTNEKYLETGIDIYIQRLKHYVTFDHITLKDVKSVGDIKQLKILEGKQFLTQVTQDDFVILLDERGKEYTSLQWSAEIEKFQLKSIKRLVFIIGGAYGFSEEVYTRANLKMSLSQLTFSHQMIRLFFVEQLYRAYTIIKGEKYHNE